MKKRESKLWLRIKNLKLKGQIFRIESNASRPLAEALETF
jgi:hypothetical protein